MRPWLVVLLALVLSQPANADARKARSQEAIEKSQSAMGALVPEVVFRNGDGREMRLSGFRGRPLLVTLIYTGCVDVCPTLIEALAPAVEVARETFGADAFSVITVGFDVKKDTPEQMRSFARNHGVSLSNWHFLATDAAGLDILARAVGFAYYSRAGGFDHTAQVSVIDAKGRVYQQIYGTSFDPPLIVEPLKNLIYGTEKPLLSMQGIIDRVRWFCTTYDPNAGRYRFNYSFFIGIFIGLASLGLVLTMIIREWRRSPVKSSDLTS